MNRVRMTLLSAGFAAIRCAAHAADPGATALLPADSVSSFKLSSTAGESAKMSTVAVKGQPFSSALRIEVSSKPRRSADVQISAPTGAATASGDVLMVSFWMRSGAAGKPRSTQLSAPRQEGEARPAPQEQEPQARRAGEEEECSSASRR